MAGSQGNGSRASGKTLAAIERQRQALELRKGGATYERIAQSLGYAGPQGAYAAIQKALKRSIQEPATEVRQLEAARLDRLQLALWKQATEGGGEAIKTILKIMHRRAQILGLDAPAEVEHGGQVKVIVEYTDAPHRPAAPGAGGDPPGDEAV